MKMISIRKAIDSDFEQIWPVFHRVVATGDTYAFDPNISQTDARSIWMSSQATTYVVVDDKKIVGAYILKPNHPGLGSHVANASFMVDPDAQGKGIGKQMGLHALDEAVKAGYLAMQFNLVVSTNEAAVALWKKLGFSIVATLPNAFNHKELGLVDAYIMYRSLTES